ncbi:MAG: CoB--CoM heterodisulfide reductase iron-sulfur subunit A family protein [Chloroflexota bacterium]
MTQAPDDRVTAVNSSVLVVGAGIAGIQAALEIADSEHQVYLVEREPSIGGHMAQFDKTFPTLDCAACISTPKTTAVGQHPHIRLMTYSEVVSVSGSAGHFKIKVRRKPRYVDEKKCVGCGICQQKCPWKASSEFDAGMSQRKAIYTLFAQAVPNIPVIDTAHCAYFLKGTCRACEKFCDAKAIDFQQKELGLELEVGNIIVATGFDTFDAARIPQYGYGRYPNVFTGLECERLLNATGPTSGQVLLKDGSTPKSVAIIHCVGSRDKNYRKYCSRVCCMYSLKQAHLIRERAGAEIYQMYIDMRCFGKGYEEFYERVSEEGVNFIRGKASMVTDVPDTEEENGKLMVICEDTLLGKILRVPVDMVILGVGLEPRSDAEKVASIFGLKQDSDGFFLERHPKLDPLGTVTDGIYVAGCCQGPKDIPDSVVQASGSAAKALSMVIRSEVEKREAAAISKR